MVHEISGKKLEGQDIFGRFTAIFKKSYKLINVANMETAIYISGNYRKCIKQFRWLKRRMNLWLPAYFTAHQVPFEKGLL